MTVIEFTDTFKHTYSSFSPDGNYIVSSLQHRIIIRRLDFENGNNSLEVVNAFAIPELVSSLPVWAPNSYHIALIGSTSSASESSSGVGGNAIYLVKRSGGGDENEKDSSSSSSNTLLARFEMPGPLIRLENVKWSPDSRFLLMQLCHKLAILVFDLSERRIVAQLANPKISTCYGENGWGSFRPDGSLYYLYLQRDAGRDFLCLHDCTAGWQCVGRYPLVTEGAGLRNVEAALWAPDGRSIFVHEGIIGYRWAIYAPDGRQLATSNNNINNNKDESSDEQKDDLLSLGIRSAAWSPSSQFIALGGYDHSLAFINAYTWKLYDWLGIPTLLPCHLVPDPNLTVYREKRIQTVSGGNSIGKTSNNSAYSVQFEYCTSPVDIPASTNTSLQVGVKRGISMLSFNCDGTLLAFKDDSVPNILFIFSMIQTRLISVLIMSNVSPIKQLIWHKSKADHLWFLCSSSTSSSSSSSNSLFYYWTLAGANVIDIQTLNNNHSASSSGSFSNCRELECHPLYPDTIMVKDRNSFCLGFVSNSNEDEEIDAID